MQLLDGKKLAAEIRANLKKDIIDHDLKPGLGVILVGEDQASHLYVTLKEKSCLEAGIHFEKFVYPHDAPEAEIIKKIEELNDRNDINGILVQLPLPPNFDTEKIINTMDPRKDADGFHPENIRLLSKGKPYIYPGVHLGIIELIRMARVTLKDKVVTVVSNSAVFAAPLGRMLEDCGAETHFTIMDAKDAEEFISDADILVVAVGRPGFVRAEMLKPGAIVIDVGTTRTPNGLRGDADFESVKHRVSWITPVPGGVGPMTIAMLLSNVVDLYKKQNGLKDATESLCPIYLQ